MRFDDRLLTVLSQPAGDRHDAAVRWRQLIDLVARAGLESDGPVVTQALEAIRADAPTIEESLRAAAARAIAGRPLPIGLLEYLVSDRLSVSAPVLAAATLEPAHWRALLELADEETRQFIMALHSEIASAPETVDRTIESAAPATSGEEAPPPSSTLSEVVARIERRRRSRDAHRLAPDGVLPAEAPSLFRWECGPSGEIAWVEGAPRGAVIGRSIARVQDSDDDRIDDEVARAFARRAPFREAEMTVVGEGLLAGSWKISGLPAFDSTDGRFAGYRGIAQRNSAPPPVQREIGPDMLNDPDSLRELVHEIKTPLNAIIGFAEIIQGQYLGPADQRYRERATEIVAQAHLLLGAIDDLDFAAKVHSAAAGSERSDLSQIMQGAGTALVQLAREKGIELDLAGRSGDCIAALEPEIADRLIMRLASLIIDCADAGEHLRLSLEESGSSCRIVMSRPASLRNVQDKMLFEGLPGTGEGDASCSPGFPLRLVRGLARMSGGDLVASPTSLSLVVPRA